VRQCKTLQAQKLGLSAPVQKWQTEKSSLARDR